MIFNTDEDDLFNIILSIMNKKFSCIPDNLKKETARIWTKKMIKQIEQEVREEYVQAYVKFLKGESPDPFLNS